MSRNAFVIVLALVSGFVDALSYVSLGEIFTANMTGNVVLLGVAVAQRNGLRIGLAATALTGFIAGVFTGTRMAGVPPDDDVPFSPPVSRVLVVEFCVLLVFLAGWDATRTHPAGAVLALLVLCSGLAMGLQTAAARKINLANIATTYVTGTLAGVVADVAMRTHTAIGARIAAIAALFAGAAIAVLLLPHARSLVPACPLVVIGALLVTAGRVRRAWRRSAAG